MAVSIRLSRGGRKKQPFYHIVVADSRFARDSRFIEKLGYYNPCVDGGLLSWEKDRVAHWLNQGAQPSTTVAKMILSDKTIGTEKQRARMAAPIDRRRNIIEQRLAAAKAAKAAEEKAAQEAAAKEAAAE